MIGHEEAIAAFKDAFTGARPHHAWLLVGPQGLGKALFAQEAAAWLLDGCPEGRGFTGAIGSTAANLMADAAHPDFRRLERTRNDKGNLSAFIRIDEVRALQSLLHQRPAYGGWRVVLVDAADELNVQAANALLKSLEEPLERTVFLMVCHRPSRLLPTIRSRCCTLRFRMLDDGDVRAVLRAEVPDLDDDDRDLAVRIAAGCPGRAVRLAEPGIASLEAELAELARTPPAAAPARAQALARSVAGKGNVARYEALLERAPAFIAEAAHRRSGPALARALADWEAAAKLAGEAQPLSLEPGQVAFDLACRVAALAEG